jgi:carbon monoxide dehydrogenase subunit G
MAEVEYSSVARLPVETIWEFVQEMDNWAPWVAGYQGHEKESETESVWTLKGDVGVLARTVKFRVKVTEWAGPERVRFALEGLNEPMLGSGEFVMTASAETMSTEPAASRPGWFSRLIDAVFRFFFRLRHGRVEREQQAAGSDTSRLTFTLRVDPGGPMAPMVNALMRPAMLPAAENLAERIIAHLEGTMRQGADR